MRRSHILKTSVKPEVWLLKNRASPSNYNNIILSSTSFKFKLIYWLSSVIPINFIKRSNVVNLMNGLKDFTCSLFMKLMSNLSWDVLGHKDQLDHNTSNKILILKI